MCGNIFIVLLLYGIFIIIQRTDSRAVNITNSWTLPQEDFGVFYRFFRDKISWFEADAVCQFHHANLATVNNGLQFDAVRAFLKELDVNEPVWIGLMRPQGTDKFTWSNTKPLSLASDYWAESLPTLESPLCAVVDPVHDFRWHALHCGGPEIASFLCEMNVPDWAKECTIRAMPSLTIQYMSDSGSIQLSRDCGDDGTKHMICHGKQDHKTILKQLTCSDEDNNAFKVETESPIKLINIKALPSEKNNEILSNRINQNIKQIDSIELMQSDQPVFVKPNMKFAKKFINIKKVKTINDEIMQGDQPIGSIQDVLIDESQFVEILPHNKKSLNQEFQKSKDFIIHEENAFIQTSMNPLTTHEENEISTSMETIRSVKLNNLSHSADEVETATVTTNNIKSTINDKLSTIVTTGKKNFVIENVTKHSIISIENNAHPMHAPKDIIRHTENDFVPTHVSHLKHGFKTNTIGDDHFVPPMLLLKAKFTPRPHFEQVSVHKQLENQTSESTSSTNIIDQPNISFEPKGNENKMTTTEINMESDNQTNVMELASTPLSYNNKIDNIEIESSDLTNDSLTIKLNELQTFPTIIQARLDGKILGEERILENVSETNLPIISSINNINCTNVENNNNHNYNVTILPPISAKITTELPLDIASIFTLNDVKTDIKLTRMTTQASPEFPRVMKNKNNIILTTLPILSTIITTDTNTDINYTPNPMTTHDIINEDNLNISKKSPIKPSLTTIDSISDINNETTEKHIDYENNFSNIENFQPYKPNRRRSLIKIDTIPHSYIKKILG